jgi:hypothetical protein
LLATSAVTLIGLAALTGVGFTNVLRASDRFKLFVVLRKKIEI